MEMKSPLNTWMNNARGGSDLLANPINVGMNSQVAGLDPHVTQAYIYIL